jgi:peptidoglycan/xylan/chitin deacetylase (PgdA/CDA1 family)
MLSFSILEGDNLPEWCKGLSNILEKHDIPATIFISGKTAQNIPECITAFNKDVDIGSQTYDYVNLSSISDYQNQLEEVRKGKEIIDSVGQLDSRLFRAPYGAIDENIYSLLNRTGIIADFSYDSQYNKYFNGKFIWFNLTSFDGTENTADFFLSFDETEIPILINFDSDTSLEYFEEFIEELMTENIQFVNASELTELDLTIRNE